MNNTKQKEPSPSLYLLFQSVTPVQRAPPRSPHSALLTLSKGVRVDRSTRDFPALAWIRFLAAGPSLSASGTQQSLGSPLTSLSCFLLSCLKFFLLHYSTPRVGPEPFSLLSAPFFCVLIQSQALCSITSADFSQELQPACLDDSSTWRSHRHLSCNVHS